MIDRLLSRLRDERGISMVAVMGALLVSTLLVVSAFAAANGDIKLARGDQDDKAAYAAADAGIQYYFFHLAQDNTYWTNCTTVPAPSATEASPVVQKWTGTGTDTRTGHWRYVAGSTEAKYAIELLPANGYTQCSTTAPSDSMLDPDTGAFRIRSTGIFRGQRRTLIATFKRRSFLDYLYFTDFETADPVTYVDATSIAWATANCQMYKRQGRSSSCTSIQFADADVLSGPFHTNDQILVCGTPTFGRSSSDSIEISAGSPGWTSNCQGSVPDFQGTLTTSAGVLTMPPTNATLSQVATSAYKFTGKTTIVLNGSQMNVTNPSWSGTRTMALPTNGVIYVQSGSCGTSGYSMIQNYTTPSGCGDVWVSGTYSQSLTIAADNDVVINGSITHSGDTLMGLIANNFVRIYHPVTRDPQDYTSCTNASGTMTNVQIDAALLALSHSFIVDNWYCGPALGTLTVNGAIAQKFRGPVGRGSGTSKTNGYTKAYAYDDRLRFREPPSFLDPVQAQWRLARETEQVPAR